MIDVFGQMGYGMMWAPLLPLLALWGLFWKGIALWHAAQRGHQWWFIAMLVINILGLLEIAYLFFILKLKLNELFTSRIAPQPMPGIPGGQTAHTGTHQDTKD